MSQADQTRRRRRRAGEPSVVIARAALALVVAAAGVLAATVPARAAEGGSRPAAIIAAAEGTVWVTSAEGERVRASVGQRLLEGDEVSADEGAHASIYFSGGHIVRIPGGNRLEVIRDPGSAPAVARTARMSAPAVKVVEEGLWVVTDPAGRLLLTGMRGVDEGAAEIEGPQLLSPRNEVVLGSRPTFYWAADAGPVRLGVGTAGQVIWTGEPASPGSTVYPDDAPALSAATEYLWWLEDPATGDAVSARARFRVVSAETREEVRRVERELDGIEAEERPLAGFLRCAYYVGQESWTRALVAAHRLSAIDPDSDYASHAAALAERRMSLTKAGSRTLIERLSN